MRTEIIRLYENRDDVTLTTYRISDSAEMLDGKSRPAVLICPGGMYMNCSDREGEPIALKFAAMGYHAFVLRYSTYFEGKTNYPDTSGPIPPNPNCQHPIPMREIGKAFLMIHDRAEEWKVDPARIAICGFSAGAHNCAMYATNWSKAVITDYFQADKKLLRPAAAILGYTLSDYVYMDEVTRKDPAARHAFDMSNTAFLGGPTTDAKLLEQISPARNVSQNTPPMFLWATAEDGMVPVQHSILLAKALADQKIPFEMHIFEQGDHGLATATQASASAWSETDPNAAKWMDLCDAWLMKRFRFDLPRLNKWQMLMQNQQR